MRNLLNGHAHRDAQKNNHYRSKDLNEPILIEKKINADLTVYAIIYTFIHIFISRL